MIYYTIQHETELFESAKMNSSVLNVKKCIYTFDQFYHTSIHCNIKIHPVKITPTTTLIKREIPTARKHFPCYYFIQTGSKSPKLSIQTQHYTIIRIKPPRTFTNYLQNTPCPSPFACTTQLQRK